MGIFKNKNWKEKGLQAVNGHKGKKKVYETYLNKSPKMADEYLKFVAKNAEAVYISWDEDKQRFVA